VARDVEACWIVDQLARQGGWYSTPRPAPQTILDAPLCGSGVPEVGRVATPVGSPVWDRAAGLVGLNPATGVRPVWRFGDPTPWRGIMPVPGFPSTPAPTQFNVAYSGDGAVLRFRLPTLSGDVDLDLLFWRSGTFHMRVNEGPWANGTWTPGLNRYWPTRGEFEVTTDGTVISCRIRSTDTDTAWSSPITVNLSDASMDPASCEVQWLFGSLAAVQVALGPCSWEPPTAVIPLLDAHVPAPWLPDGDNVWDALQAVLGAYAAAGWTDAEGHLTVLNRHELAGVNRPKTPVDVDTMADDIPWRIAADDYADRLEVTWWPVSRPDEWDDPWEHRVDEKVQVPARSAVTIEARLDGYVERLFPWAHVDTTGVDWSITSEWDANTVEDGSGSVVTAGVSVTTDRLSPARARLTIRNTNPFPVWLVDPSGSPAMILRGDGIVRQESGQVIEYGAPALEAENPLEVDLGKTVQDRAAAEAIAAYVWERVNAPRWRAGSVRLPLDLGRDLGDILALEHPASGLRVNAMVTRIRLDGYAQTHDLVVLPTTWADFDAAWAGRTGTDFDAAWAGRTGGDFDRDPLRTGA